MNDMSSTLTADVCNFKNKKLLVCIGQSLEETFTQFIYEQAEEFIEICTWMVDNKM